MNVIQVSKSNEKKNSLYCVKELNVNFLSTIRLISKHFLDVSDLTNRLNKYQ